MDNTDNYKLLYYSNSKKGWFADPIEFSCPQTAYHHGLFNYAPNTLLFVTEDWRYKVLLKILNAKEEDFDGTPFPPDDEVTKPHDFRKYAKDHTADSKTEESVIKDTDPSYWR